jgi:hypothetical protein
MSERHRGSIERHRPLRAGLIGFGGPLERGREAADFVHPDAGAAVTVSAVLPLFPYYVTNIAGMQIVHAVTSSSR